MPDRSFFGGHKRHAPRGNSARGFSFYNPRKRVVFLFLKKFINAMATIDRRLTICLNAISGRLQTTLIQTKGGLRDESSFPVENSSARTGWKECVFTKDVSLDFLPSKGLTFNLLGEATDLKTTVEDVRIMFYKKPYAVVTFTTVYRAKNNDEWCAISETLKSALHSDGWSLKDP
jgi:hypothetical protein